MSARADNGSELVERLLAVPAAADGVGRVALATDSVEAVLRWANNTMTTNGHSVTRSWSVVALVRLDTGTGVGVISSSGPLDEPEAVVRAAEAAAREAGPARDVAELPTPDGPADPDWTDPPGETQIGVFAPLAEQLAEAFDRAGGAGGDGGAAARRTLYGFATHEVATLWLGTSAGVRRRWTQPSGSVELNAKTADRARSSWGARPAATATDWAALDLLALEAELATRLGWGARRVTARAGRQPVILPPSATADLMTYLAWSMAGRPAREGRSPFAGHEGGRITPLPLTLSSDPSGALGPAASPDARAGLATVPFLATTHSGDEVSVFDNGAPLGRTDWITEGVVTALGYPRAAAAEFGTRFAAPAANLALTGGGPASTEDLVAGTERGLLLTCLWYIRVVDPTNLLLTGLTRDGVYAVEGGEVVGEVTNFRFNESPLELLRRADTVGVARRTLPREFKDWFTRTVMPAIRIPDFNLSSESRAS